MSDASSASRERVSRDAIDRIIDMMSTTTNITGDTFTAVLVAKHENELDLDTYNRYGPKSEKEKSQSFR